MSCRLSGMGVFDTASFRSLACAQCLYYIYFLSAPHGSIYTTRTCLNGLSICSADDVSCGSCSSSTTVYNVPEFALNMSSVRPLSTLQVTPPLPPLFASLVTQCCEAAAACCTRVLAPDEEAPTPPATGSGHSAQDRHACPATWDGWLCFAASQEPQVLHATCPPFIYGDRLRLHEGQHVRKECTPIGWQKHFQDDKEWTDYSKCHAEELGTWAQLKHTVGIVANSMSICAVLPALVIISSFRSLRAQSVFVIHQQLLLSFLLVSVSYVFNTIFFIVDGAPGEALFLTNHISCRVLFTIQLRFARLATYSWMLAEGVTSSAFSSRSSPPTMRVSPATNSSAGTNFVLVAAILCVLIKKLRYNPHLEPMSYKKAVRAASMLVPVFGLHLLFTIIRIESNSAHQLINIAMDGLQGLAVAVILCYANHGVAERLKMWLRSLRQAQLLRRECRSHSIAGAAAGGISRGLNNNNNKKQKTSLNARDHLNNYSPATPLTQPTRNSNSEL